MTAPAPSAVPGRAVPGLMVPGRPVVATAQQQNFTVAVLTASIAP